MNRIRRGIETMRVEHNMILTPMKMSVSIRAIVLACVSLVALAACEGDGLDGTVTDSEPLNDGEGLNGPVTGKIMIGKELMDLSSGFRRTLNSVRDFNTVGLSPDGVYIAGTHYPGNNYCWGDWLLPSCFAISRIEDLTGSRIRGGSVIDERVQAVAPQISPDNKRFILFGNRNEMIIWTRETRGERINMIALARKSGVQRAFWGPDGAVYYTTGYQLRRWDIEDDSSGADTLIWEFADTDFGMPYSLSVHPDGQRIAVDRRLSSSTEQVNSIWMVQSDGSSARPFITTNASDALRYPVWSPDGRYLAVAVNGSNGAGSSPVPVQSGIVAFDASYTTHSLTLTGDLDGPGRISLKVYCFARRTCESKPINERRVPANEIKGWAA